MLLYHYAEGSYNGNVNSFNTNSSGTRVSSTSWQTYHQRGPKHWASTSHDIRRGKEAAAEARARGMATIQPEYTRASSSPPSYEASPAENTAREPKFFKEPEIIVYNSFNNNKDFNNDDGSRTSSATTGRSWIWRFFLRIRKRFKK